MSFSFFFFLSSSLFFFFFFNKAKSRDLLEREGEQGEGTWPEGFLRYRRVATYFDIDCKLRIQRADWLESLPRSDLGTDALLYFR